MDNGHIPDENEIYLRQLSLGVKRSFFEYFYSDNMNEEYKELIREKAKLAIEYLKERLKKGYEEYSKVYDENYQFIKGVRVSYYSNYYKFKKIINDLISFYTLNELQDILKEEYYDAIFEMHHLSKYNFFEYFYTDYMSKEDQEETNEKVKIAIRYESSFSLIGYELFCDYYNKDTYTRLGIKKLEGEKRNQFKNFINRITLLIEPYSLKELQEMYSDICTNTKQVQFNKIFNKE